MLRQYSVRHVVPFVALLLVAALLGAESAEPASSDIQGVWPPYVRGKGGYGNIDTELLMAMASCDGPFADLHRKAGSSQRPGPSRTGRHNSGVLLLVHRPVHMGAEL